MNLMFWKKRTGTGKDAGSAQENPAVNTEPRKPLDVVAVEQKTASSGTEQPDAGPSGAGETGPETPARPGLVTRMKLRLNALTKYFRKAPTFRAEEGSTPDVSGAPEESDNAAALEPETESRDAEAPAKPGLAMQLKSRLITLVRRFRKTPVPDTEEPDAGENESRAGRTGESRDRSEASPEDEHSDGGAATEPVRSRRWLVIGGSVVIVVLLLVEAVIANWPIFKPPQKRWGTRHDTTSISSRPPDSEPVHESSPVPVPEKSRAEAEALRKENAELQVQIEALKRQPPPPRSFTSPVAQTGEATPSSSVSGEVTLDNKDPKAAAMSLKEAIEAMNAGTGGYAKKTTK